MKGSCGGLHSHGFTASLLHPPNNLRINIKTSADGYKIRRRCRIYITLHPMSHIKYFVHFMVIGMVPESF